MSIVLTEKTTWLVVEDDFSIRGLLSLLIDMWGYRPLTFSNGYEVMTWLDKVEQGAPSIILPKLALLDIRMPGPQGYDIAQRLRKLSQTARVPIVMMTAFRFDTTERNMINELAQPSLFLNKPLPPPDELKQMLEEVLKLEEFQRPPLSALENRPTPSEQAVPPPQGTLSNSEASSPEVTRLQPDATSETKH